MQRWVFAIMLGWWGWTAPFTASAFECTTGQTCNVTLRWTERSLGYTVRLPTAAAARQAEIEAATAASFDVWSRPSCTDLEFFREATVIQDMPSDDSLNEVVLVLNGWAVDLGNNPDAVGLTTTRHSVFTGVIVRGLVEINEEDFNLANADVTCPDRPVRDLQSVLVHEAGHFIGFAHPCENAFNANEALCGRPFCTELLVNGEPPDDLTTMWPDVAVCDTRFRTLTTDDLDGLCTIYPAGQDGRACRVIDEGVDPNIGNKAFGCTNGGAPSNGLWLILIGLGYGFFRRLNGHPGES